MAGAKESPRQKMVNLMYLVFIAMLAMNMSKKVLSAFGTINENITLSNEKSNRHAGVILEDLDTKAKEQPEKWGDKNKVAKSVHESSVSYFNYLDGVKAKLTKDIENKTDYESMDGETPGDELFFAGEKLTKEGKAYVDNLNKYREDVLKHIAGSIDNSDFVDVIKARFDARDVKGGAGKQPWIKARYEGFPLVSTITNITLLQKEIADTEKDVYSMLLGKQLANDAKISAKTYGTILIPEKPVVFQGERFKGKIVLGRYDSSLKPSKVTVNGMNIKQFRKGGAIIDMPASTKLGDNSLKGNFTFTQDGKDVNIPIDLTYVVISKPNSAVVSADKMNVVYRGVSNPITISMPGVSDEDIVATAPGLRKIKGSSYMLKPQQGKEVRIKVTGKLSGGVAPVVTYASFRIKNIPAPRATVRGEMGSVKMPKSSLAKSTIGAALPDFAFDLKLKITSFSIKVPGKATIKVNGSKLNAAAKRALNSAKRGSFVNIFNIKAKIENNSTYKLPEVAGISVEITN